MQSDPHTPTRYCLSHERAAQKAATRRSRALLQRVAEGVLAEDRREALMLLRDAIADDAKVTLTTARCPSSAACCPCGADACAHHRLAGGFLAAHSSVSAAPYVRGRRSANQSSRSESLEANVPDAGVAAKVS